MRFEREDAKVGMLVLTALALFAGAALHVMARKVLRGEVLQRVEMANAAELAPGTEVQLLGLHVGEVKSVDLERNGVDYRFVATLGLRPDAVLWRGTRAVVTSRVLGSPFVDLRLPLPAERTATLAPGEPIPGEAGSSATALVAELSVLTRDVDGLVSDLRREVQTRGFGSLLDQRRLTKAFDEIDHMLASFEKTSQVARGTFERGGEAFDAFDQDMESLRKSLLILQGVLEKRGPEVDALLANVGPAVEQVRAAAADLSAALKTAGPEADATLQALQRTLRSTHELIELLRAKPNRLVFGTPSEKEQEAARKKVEESERTGKPPEAPR